MKIIGTTKVGEGYNVRDAYVAIVSVEELAKVANKTAYNDRDTHGLDKLKVGDEHPLGQGHDFRAEILAAAQAMKEAHAKFLKASATMHRFVSLISAQDEQEPAP